MLLEAVTAYGDVVRDTAIVRLRENNVTVLTRDLRATQDRFNVGEVTRTDVAQAQARRAAAVAALDLARANLKTSRATFERVIGHPPSNLVEARAQPTSSPKSVQESVEISARESPNVVAALYREQAARFAVDLIRGELLPTVQLEANYTKRFDPSIAIDETETTLVTGRVTVPFYTGGEVQARVRQAKHTHIQRLQEIEQARTEVQAQVVTAWSQLQAAKAAVESDTTAVDANRIALAGVREEERVGQRTLLDVLNAEQELLNSEVNLVTDRRNVLVASYAVLSTIGRLNAQELGVGGAGLRCRGALPRRAPQVVRHLHHARRWPPRGPGGGAAAGSSAREIGGSPRVFHIPPAASWPAQLVCRPRARCGVCWCRPAASAIERRESGLESRMSPGLVWDWARCGVGVEVRS